jgi:hypothetical protein
MRARVLACAASDRAIRQPRADARPCRPTPGRDVELQNQSQETPMAKATRTTHRSTKGKKLYAVRDKKGQFKDIQSYKRAHSADIKRKSKKEK